MDEKLRPTKAEVHLIDIDEEMPGAGQTVLALGMGGSLVSTVWTSKSHEFFKAWMPYPRIPAPVKEKLYQLYLGGSKGESIDSCTGFVPVSQDDSRWSRDSAAQAEEGGRSQAH